MIYKIFVKHTTLFILGAGFFMYLIEALNNNLTKHFIWKRRQCNVMKKNTISSIKYICHNKQLKNLYKLMPININQQVITFNIHKTPDSDIFQLFFQFLNLKLVPLMKFMPTSSFSLLYYSQHRACVKIF